MLKVIGNSHAGIFSGKQQNWATWPDKCPDYIPNIQSFQLGPIIAYNFEESHLSKFYEIINRYPPDKDDWFLFVIGEVDCRWHIPFQADIQQKKFEDIIIECVDRYFRTLLKLKKEGYNIAVLSVHPSTSQGHNDDKDSPVFGDYLYRNSITEFWNIYIHYLCRMKNIPYVSTFYDLINPDHTRKEEYFMDYCHLSEKALPLLLERVKTCIPNLNI